MTVFLLILMKIFVCLDELINVIGSLDDCDKIVYCFFFFNKDIIITFGILDRGIITCVRNPTSSRISILRGYLTLGTDEI